MECVPTSGGRRASHAPEGLGSYVGHWWMCDLVPLILWLGLVCLFLRVGEERTESCNGPIILGLVSAARSGSLWYSAWSPSLSAHLLSSAGS